MRFPFTHAGDGQLGIVRSRGNPSDLSVSNEDPGGRVDFVVTPLKHAVDNTLLTPLNTLVDFEKSRRTKKRDEKGRQRKNGRPRVHVFEIPELYVNARPYEDIEAEEGAWAVAAKEESDEEAMVVIEAEEQEALVAVAAAALAARHTRDTRSAWRFLQVPERF